MVIVLPARPPVDVDVLPWADPYIATLIESDALAELGDADALPRTHSCEPAETSPSDFCRADFLQARLW